MQRKWNTAPFGLTLFYTHASHIFMDIWIWGPQKRPKIQMLLAEGSQRNVDGNVKTKSLNGFVNTLKQAKRFSTRKWFVCAVCSRRTSGSFPLVCVVQLKHLTPVDQNVLEYSSTSACKRSCWETETQSAPESRLWLAVGLWAGKYMINK